MAHLLMKTAGATPEEVDGFVEALEQAGISCYVTQSGRWRIGVDALWLSDKADIERAHAVGAEYQARFAQQSRAQHRAMRARGEPVNFVAHAAQHPFKTMAGVLAIVFILGVSLLPFIRGV
ncbi:hypothetical protein KO507_09145 [Gilvimarinus agarilyticus]|uniref:DUF6164 family protein n=1 Tax=Gilvimarinus sp. 2_MG-2023 TaxID=3062666 RepID=UPI001C0A2391|nr:DUF6164 family protein [Gilvimarinus sp. 2_MG-2023]MBU2885925.1 hypothetical protein [Gilvimarinus agarilyticus]MDO6570671.1 DUF6164 family protein [Gilvimarinus sp. 2_MG-2023]